jgi:hypothetical protein
MPVGKPVGIAVGNAGIVLGKPVGNPDGISSLTPLAEGVGFTAPGRDVAEPEAAAELALVSLAGLAASTAALVDVAAGAALTLAFALARALAGGGPPASSSERVHQ